MTRFKHNPPRTSGSLLLLGVLLGAIGACTATPTKPRGAPSTRDYPWALQEPKRFGADFLWRQKLEARFGERKMSFQAIVQKQGNVLTLIGLGPADSKAFVLTQTGLSIQFRSLMPRSLPFPPRFILHDLQRVSLPLTTEAPPRDGTRPLNVPGEKATERFERGRRVERRFTRMNGQPSGTIVVRYAPPTASSLPGVVELNNAWIGYSLRIETLEARAL